MDQTVKIAIAMDDGTTAVMSFLTRGRSPTLPYGAVWEIANTPGWWLREPNDANVFAEISKAFRLTDNNGLPLPQPTQYKRIADDAVPADRTYRNAWTLNGETIEHDMEKARQIQMDRIRRARTAELGKLDSAMSQADEAVFVAGKDVVAAQAAEAAKAAIIDQKQVLRDLPATFDLSKAATTEELKALWPADLPRL